MNRRSVVALAVTALVVSSGCSAVQLFDQQPSPPEEDVQAQFESLETVRATQETTMTVDNETRNTTAEVRVDLSGPFRQYYRVVAPEERAGNRLVVNDSSIRFYNATENTIRRIPRVERPRPIDRAEYVANIVAAARNDEAVSARGVSPLPVVPASGNGQVVPDEQIQAYDVSYLGTREIAGRTAHGFRLTAASEAAIDLNQTLWLDEEYYYPLKVHQRVEYDNKTVEYSTVVTDVTFNEELPADAFELNAPANATRDSKNVSVATHDSIADLRDATTLSVPDPEVPEGYEFSEARSVSGNTTSFALHYTKGDATLVVSKADQLPEHDRSQGESVTVDGRDARYVATGPSNAVIWTCDGQAYSVVSTDLSRDALLDVATSVSCE